MAEEEEPWWKKFLDEDEDEAAPAKDKSVSTRTINGTTYRLYERPDGSNYVKNLSTLEVSEGGFPSSAPAAKAPTSSASSSGGSSAAPKASSGGGGGAVAAAKPDDPGSTFTVRGADGNTYHWREYTRADGSSYYRNLETGDSSERLPTAVVEQPKKKLSPLEQAAQSLAGANRTLAGGEQAASSGQEGSSPATAPAAQGDPRLMTADMGRRLVGLDQPGYGTLMTNGTAGNNVTAMLNALHVKPSGDPQTDLRTVLGGLGERSLLEAQGMTPLEIQTMIDQRAFDRARPYGGAMPHYDAPVASVSTPAVNGQGKIVIDDTPGNYRELLQPTDEDPYAFAAGGGFKTPNPIAFVDMITGQTLGMAGGAGRETVSVDPDGPHGTPATEAKVGSKLWPDRLGVGNAYANGIDDLLDEYGFTSSGPMQSAGPQIEPPGGGTPTPDYSAENGGRDPDYVSASMLGFGQNGGKERAPNYEGVDRYFRPTLSPKEKYDMRVAQGWAQPEVLYPRANDAFKSWLRAGNFSDPIARLPEHMLPSQFLEDSSLTKARDLARRPEWYGLSEFYQADGAENTVGIGYGTASPFQQRWGAGSMDDLLGFKGLVRGGVYDNARANWGGMTPNQQESVWATMRLPGMGNPIGGNTWADPLSYPGLWWDQYGSYNYGSKPLASYFNTDAAPLSFDGYRELGSQINPNATRSLGLEAPMTTAQIKATPVNVLKSQGANANPMAAGGMIDVNPYDVTLGREAPFYNASEPVPLVDPVRVLSSLRKKVAA